MSEALGTLSKPKLVLDNFEKFIFRSTAEKLPGETSGVALLTRLVGSEGLGQTFPAENRLFWVDERWMARSEFTATLCVLKKHTWRVLCSFLRSCVDKLRMLLNTHDLANHVGLQHFLYLGCIRTSMTRPAQWMHRYHMDWTIMAVGIRNIFYEDPTPLPCDVP